MTFVKVAKKSDIPAGKMMHVEVDWKEILIADFEGKFYAIGDWCPNMNAMLFKGTLNNTIVACSRYFSCFDVITGKAISGNPQGLSVYEVKVECNDLFIDCNS